MSIESFKSKILNPTSAALRRIIGNSIEFISDSFKNSQAVFSHITSITSKLLDAIVPLPHANLSAKSLKSLENIKPISHFTSKSCESLFDLKPVVERDCDSPDFTSRKGQKSSLRRSYQGNPFRTSSDKVNLIEKKAKIYKERTRSSFDFCSDFKQINRNFGTPSDSRPRSIENFNYQTYKNPSPQTIISSEQIGITKNVSPMIMFNESVVFDMRTSLPTSTFNNCLEIRSSYNHQSEIGPVRASYNLNPSLTQEYNYRNENTCFTPDYNYSASAAQTFVKHSSIDFDEINNENNPNGASETDQRKKFKARRLYVK